MYILHRQRTMRVQRDGEKQSTREDRKEIARENERRTTRRNTDDNQSSVIIDRRTNDGGKSFFSFSSPLFTLITIIEILLSRSTHATKAKHKQNINFSVLLYVSITFILTSIYFHYRYLYCHHLI